MIQRVKDSFHNDILLAMVCLIFYFQQTLHQKKMRFYKMKEKSRSISLTTDEPHYAKVAEHSYL